MGNPRAWRGPQTRGPIHVQLLSTTLGGPSGTTLLSLHVPSLQSMVARLGGQPGLRRAYRPAPHGLPSRTVAPGVCDKLILIFCCPYTKAKVRSRREEAGSVLEKEVSELQLWIPGPRCPGPHVWQPAADCTVTADGPGTLAHERGARQRADALFCLQCPSAL